MDGMLGALRPIDSQPASVREKSARRGRVLSDN